MIRGARPMRAFSVGSVIEPHLDSDNQASTQYSASEADTTEQDKDVNDAERRKQIELLSPFVLDEVKQLTVRFDNVSVYGQKRSLIPLKTVPSAFSDRLIKWCTLGGTINFNINSKKSAEILHKVNLTISPGELLFVLGRQDSGSADFLDIVTGNIDKYSDIKGNIRFSNQDFKTFRKEHPAESLYCSAHDEHYPDITVEETLRFALRTKIPKNLPTGVNNTSQWIEDALSAILDLLHIQHTRSTKVGNEYIRGISGGERKRVSIGEAMATGAALVAWDQSTKGLDSATSESLARSLKTTSKLFGTTHIASFYQASDKVLLQFDRVLVLEKGHTIFLGSTSELLSYFQQLGFTRMPRQPIADFVAACIEEKAVEFFINAYQNRLNGEMVRDNNDSTITKPETFENVVNNEKHVGKFVGRTTYTVSFASQIKAVLFRSLQSRLQDWTGTMATYIINLLIAILIGTAYVQLPASSKGAFTRGGLLYLILIYSPLEIFGLVPNWYEGRRVANRHVRFRLHRPAALEIGLWLAEMPALLLQLMIFLIPIYFISGLHLSAGAFFTLYLLLWQLYNVFFHLCKITTNVFRELSSAVLFNVVVVTASVIFSGYLVPLPSLPVFVKWIYYINPARYAWQAAMINEFQHLSLSCDGDDIVPTFESVEPNAATVGPFQTCSLAGATPGQQEFQGTNYLEASYAFSPSVSNLWRNVGILFGFMAGLFLANLAIAELAYWFKFGVQDDEHVRYATPKEVRERRRNDVESNVSKSNEKKSYDTNSATKEVKDNHEALSTTALTWKNISYEVPSKDKKSQFLLKDNSGYAARGSLTALMGGSGAGKTTLLDVLAGRKTIGKVHGDIRFAGKPVDANFQKRSGYCEQMDVHNPTAIVREALWFSAKLRSPANTSSERLDENIQDVVELLSLEDIFEVQVASLNVEEMKRLTIAIELVAQTDAILYLDEPTSGLDGKAANAIVQNLRTLAAKRNLAIVCTIHQPSATLFETFDRLILLGQGGLTLYGGKIGSNSSALLAYLRDQGAQWDEPVVNPAELVIKLVNENASQVHEWSEKWQNSAEKRAIDEEIAQFDLCRESKDNQSLNYPGFWVQMREVMIRELRTQWRLPSFNYALLMVHFAIALLVGLTWLKLDDSLQDMNNTVFAIFISIFLPAFIFTEVQPLFMESRKIFYREASGGTYSNEVFALTQWLGQLPIATIAGTIYFVLFYFLCGFPTQATRAGYSFLLFLIAEWYAFAIGQAIAALVPNLLISGLLVPFVLVVYELFCGITIPKPDMVFFWRYWLLELNPYTRLVSGLLTTVLHNRNFFCTSASRSVTFLVPPGQTCGSYAQSFIQSSGFGYLEDEANTTMCTYCPFRTGDEYLESIGFYFKHRYRDLGIMAAHLVMAVIVLLMACRFVKYNKR